MAALTLDPAFRVGTVDPRLYGTFVEHMGRCVYTGIFEPGHPTADADGFRADVLELVRELGPTAVRYPGGNFVSGYRWEDGIGPVSERPRRLDLAWRTVETNEVGVDEFTAWCRRAGLDPVMAVNLGTRGVQEAADLLEYCNHPEGTALSDLRRTHGAKEPHDIRTWCLGNELDGPWQVGHKTAHEYGRLAAETARAMRMVDPSIELVACGSSNSSMPTFASWEATMLEECYDLVDYVSLHTYYDPHATDRASFLASSLDLEQMIETIVATADHVGARRPRRQLRLSVDEWNVWHQSRFAGRTPEYGDVDPPSSRTCTTSPTPSSSASAHRDAAPRRPDRHRVPGAAGQRDRADPDPGRRPRVAADDLPPVRAGQPLRARRGAPRGAAVAHHSTADHDDVPLLDAIAT